ncbi:MAG: EpsG family protein, partial [Lachnospiraceae bacterium]|nr:EpsG family protein [Lachnospiraceae bacterium]
IAVLFHTHAFMFAIIPFLFEKPWGKITWLGLAIVLFAMATYDSTLGAFMKYAQSIGALVDESELFDGHQVNMLRVIVYWIPPLMALFFRDRLFHDSSRIENLFVNMSTVSAFILMIGMVQGANLYARMAGYFEIMTAVTLPWMIKKIFNKRSANLITVIAYVCFFGYFCYEFSVSKSFGQQYRAISLWQFIVELFS